MNALDGTTRAAVVVYGGADEPPTGRLRLPEWLPTRGYHGVAALRVPVAPTRDGDHATPYAAHVAQFLEENRLRHRVYGPAVEEFLRDSATTALQPISLVTVASTAVLRRVLCELTGTELGPGAPRSSPAKEPPRLPWLVVLIDAASAAPRPDGLWSAAAPAAHAEALATTTWPASLAWATSATPSYVSELVETHQLGGTAALAQEPMRYAPFVMLSRGGLVRDRGWTAGCWRSNVVTAASLLREVGFKTAQLPKYGA